MSLALLRFRLPFCSLIVAMFSQGVIAAPPRSMAQTTQASTQLQQSRIRFHLLETVEFPLRLRQIDSEIKITRNRIESLRRRHAEYVRFKTSALFSSLETVRVELFAATQKLKDLKFERLLLQENYKQERRLRLLELRAAERKIPLTQTAAN